MAGNIFEFVYTQLSGRIAGAANGERLTIDLWNSQPELQAAEGKIIVAPAIYFDLAEIDWKTLSDGAQRGTLKVGVYILQRLMANTAVNEANQGRALAIFRLLQDVHLLLQNFQAEDPHDPTALPDPIYSIGGFSRLNRLSNRVHADFPGGYICHLIEYECLVTDTSTYQLQGDNFIQNTPLKVNFA